jgi:hypothetical protein
VITGGRWGGVGSARTKVKRIPQLISNLLGTHATARQVPQTRLFLLNQEIKVHKTPGLEFTLRERRDGFANASYDAIL